MTNLYFVNTLVKSISYFGLNLVKEISMIGTQQRDLTREATTVDLNFWYLTFFAYFLLLF